MKTTFIIIILVILGSTFLYAYVPTEDIEGVRFKFYSENINKTLATEYVLEYKEYYQDLDFVKIYPEYSHKKVWGLYHLNTGVSLWNWDKDTVVHEMAHHCQWKEKRPLWELLMHTESFYDCYERVENKEFELK